MLRLGLVINPYAGLGGPAGLKGSDSLPAQFLESQKPGQLTRSAERALRTLKGLEGLDIQFFTPPGVMGADLLAALGFSYNLVPVNLHSPTNASDTCQSVTAMQQAGIDLLVFVGGDGTARDVCSVVDPQQLVLGIPAGVKMHSGVFALSPEAAIDVIRMLVEGRLVDVLERDVRDIDETAFRQGLVRTRHFGELRVPAEGRFVQRVKDSGREVEALVLEDIAAEVLELLEPDVLYILGPGSTTMAIKNALGIKGTLLGVDLVCNNQLVAADVNEARILAALDQFADARLVVTPIGGQGHLFGRGNQQLSPSVLWKVGKQNILVVATKTKITNLGGRPLVMDSNDPKLDQAFTGYMEVITGYRDRIYYPLAVSST